MVNMQDGINPEVRTIKASEFKAKCLKLMDEVAETGQDIIITKNGRPVSRSSPPTASPPAPSSAPTREKSRSSAT